MALKFQTMANEYFEIMMILKNMRTVKSLYPKNIISWTLVKCQISWLVMTKKPIQMEKLETCDNKLRLKLVIGKSLVLAFIEKCEKILSLQRWLLQFTLYHILLAKVTITFHLIFPLTGKGNYYLSSCIFHLIGKGDYHLSSCISSYWQR